MIPELRDLVTSYCQNLDDILIFLGYHRHLDKDLIRLPKSYILPTTDQCAQDGYLLSLHYLHALGLDCDTGEMDFASANGHLDVVKFLHSLKVDCTAHGMTYASANGHLEVVKYLYSIGVDCTDYAIDLASENGHTEIVEFLKSV